MVYGFVVSYFLVCVKLVLVLMFGGNGLGVSCMVMVWLCFSMCSCFSDLVCFSGVWMRFVYWCRKFVW